VLLVTEVDDLPVEISTLTKLPGCNRIVTPIHYSWNQPDENHGIATYEHYPLGDLEQWKEINFSVKNYKPVPESYVWRFFLHMSQALAVLQNQIGLNREEREIILHLDIKSKNILVVKNGSSTCPSFMLHDFGCAQVYRKVDARVPAILGTFEYQPPENPYISTKAAEIWALGACVHYLTPVINPTEDKTVFGAKYVAQHG
jgi:serine/threonine protein kinase